MYKEKLSVVLAMFCFCFWAFQVPNAVAKQSGLMSGEQVFMFLKESNARVQQVGHNFADISLQRKQITAQEGQKPYAVVITCADSRVPPEHIFAAGIGELFVIRNAGNIVGKHELASLEYAVKHLRIKFVLVLGHTHCGAVKSALVCSCEEENKTVLQDVVHDIHQGIKGETQERKAEIANVKNSLQSINAYTQLAEFMQKNNVLLQGGIYDIASGAVEFFPMQQK